jgi:hypothetical protein
MFFESFEKFPKDYKYLDAKKLLKTKLMGKKDVYFYDDSHWSPWASQIIANQLEEVISE